MSKVNDGGPAFPELRESYGGMSLRDYFAAKALQALVESAGQAVGGAAFGAGTPEARANNDRYAFVAYLLADAMLAQRSAK